MNPIAFNGRIMKLPWKLETTKVQVGSRGSAANSSGPSKRISARKQRKT